MPFAHTVRAQVAIKQIANGNLVIGPAWLLRGTEGEAVANLPDLPSEIDANSTAAYIRKVLAGTSPVPTPIAQQVTHILSLVGRL